MDHYTTLGISKTASPDEIKQAYRKLSSIHHPDKENGDTAKFQAINTAYQVLSDPQKRAEYDNPPSRFGGPGAGFHAHTGGMPPGMDDIFAQMFGQGGSPFGHQFGFRAAPQRNRDLRIELWINLEETLNEQTKTVHVNGLSRGKSTVELNIPRGVADGTQIRYTGLGDNFIETIANGDLYVLYRLNAHKSFQVDQNNLIYPINLTCFDAILGTSVEVDTIDGKRISMTIPPATQPGSKFRVPEQGLYSLHQSGRGDLIVVANVVIPNINNEEKLNTIRKLKEETT